MTRHALIFLSTDAHGVYILSAYSRGLYVVYDRCRVALLLLAEYVSMGVSLPRMVVFVTIYSNRCPILICLLVQGSTPLWIGCQENSHDCVRLLLEHDVNVNQARNDVSSYPFIYLPVNISSINNILGVL